jgi:uncharacterized protein YuzE
MKVTYDRETDSLTITLRDERIKESDEVRPGVIADFGYDGGVVRFEIMQASKIVKNARETNSPSVNERSIPRGFSRSVMGEPAVSSPLLPSWQASRLASGRRGGGMSDTPPAAAPDVWRAASRDSQGQLVN